MIILFTLSFGIHVLKMAYNKFTKLLPYLLTFSIIMLGIGHKKLLDVIMHVHVAPK